MSQPLSNPMSRSPQARANLSGSTICPRCGERNRPGVILCEGCGISLIDKDASPFIIRSIETEDVRNYLGVLKSPLLKNFPQKERVPASKRLRGTSTFDQDMVLCLQITGQGRPMALHVERQLVIGRDDGTSGPVDVDLTPYDAFRNGISRRHCAIERYGNHISLVDLKSSNGTALNGEPLTANTPHMLHHGDEILIGKMHVQVFFQRPAER